MVKSRNGNESDLFSARYQERVRNFGISSPELFDLFYSYLMIPSQA